jgi:mono/diheme cytochrome c family protein
MAILECTPKTLLSKRRGQEQHKGCIRTREHERPNTLALTRMNRLLAKIGSLALLVGACWIVTSLPRVMAQPAAAPSVLTGAYTEEQAIRGRALYYEHCLQCHGETMAGIDKAPPLAGPQFGSTWNDAPLAALVARILTMPPEKPGALLQQESVDILTYILWYNGLPLGDVSLDTGQDVLGRMTFQIPPRQ